MFADISPVYDRLNRVFSFGIDQVWRRRTASAVAESLRGRPGPVLDLATGSGDLALALEREGLEVTGADFCRPLLDIARTKTTRPLVQADALALPFADQSLAAITIAFGFRNFGDRAAALRECLRVLRPGGGLWILEFSTPYPWAAPFYHLYLHGFMPLAVRLAGGNSSAYQYLGKTIGDFPSPDRLGEQIRNAGFKDVEWQRWTMGTVALHRGYAGDFLECGGRA